MKAAIAVMMALMIAGCRAQYNRETAASLVGRSKAEILACAGAPTRQAASGGTEVMTYATSEVDEGPSTYQRVGSTVIKTGGVGTDSCAMHVVIEGGRVSRINFSGNAGSAYLCQRMLSGCR